jgi:hypothetical protein
LHEHDLIADAVKEVELSREELREVASMGGELDGVLAIIRKSRGEEQEKTGDLLHAGVGLATSDHHDLAVGEHGATLEMDSVDLVAVILELESVCHLLRMLRASRLLVEFHSLEVHDGRFDGQLGVDDKRIDGSVLVVDCNVSGDVVASRELRSRRPGIFLE